MLISCNSKIATCSSCVYHLIPRISTISKFIIAKINTSIDELNKYSNNIHEEIKSLENKQTDGKEVENQLIQLKLDLEKTLIEKENVIEKKEYVDILREVLNDKGAKAQIIKKYLPISSSFGTPINSIINPS